MSPRKAKALLSRLVCGLRVDRLLRAYQNHRLFPYIRAINYHDVPPNRAEDFERQISYYLKSYVPVGQSLLETLLSGDWSLAKPGLVLSFDDGLRSHSEVVAPILEQYQIPGWFMVPGAFVSTSPEDQREFAARHSIRHAGFNYGDPRIAMTWQQVERLGQFHAIGCHTWTHRRLSDKLSDLDLRFEIREAKRRMEVNLGREIRAFAWVGGEERSYGRNAAQTIAAAGYRYSFMTNNLVIEPGADPLWLQRTNIEASNPDHIVRFQLSGAMDLAYMRKRRRVRRQLV